jgi:transposase-like protein
MAFPGLKNGEQECDIIFCTVHIMRTWMNKIYDKKTRQKMTHAMHKRTKIGCEDLVQQAINECSITTIKNYITRNYTKNMHQWALWARQHSPLLLQVTSTNALESYHSELKRLTSPQHGLIGKYFML